MVDLCVTFTEPDLVFVSNDEVIHNVADDDFDPSDLSRRDRAVLLAFLQLAIEKVEAAG